MYEKLIDCATDYESKCNWSSAIAIYEQIYNETPTPHIISKLAWCYSRNKEYNKAKMECEKLIEQEPNNPKWLYMYGYQFYMEKNWIKAIEYYEKALEYNDEYFVVLYRTAYAYLKLAGEFLKLTKSEYWKAIGYLKKAHQIWGTFSSDTKELEKTTYYHVNFLHGKALMLIPNHNSEAIRLFKQALELKDDSDCRYNLAKALYYNGEYNQAKDMLQNEQKYYVVELSAYIEYKLGNVEEALAIVKRLLQKRKKDYLCCFIANIKLEYGDYKEAYQWTQKAISANSNNHKNYFTLARVYHKLGLFERALEALDKAEELKVRKYNSSYRDCESLRKQIDLEMPTDYIEDIQLVATLKNNDMSFCQGIIVQYNKQKGFGFVYINNQRIFVHASKCKNGELFEGAKIQFKIEITEKGQQAIDVSLINKTLTKSSCKQS